MRIGAFKEKGMSQTYITPTIIFWRGLMLDDRIKTQLQITWLKWTIALIWNDS